MHRAPVVGIVVLDGHGAPLPEPLEVAHDLARSPDMHGSHHLLVISEEQFKVRNLTHTQEPVYSRQTHTPPASYQLNPNVTHLILMQIYLLILTMLTCV